MRELTFPGFLKTYVRALSLGKTGRFKVLAAEAATQNSRLREPLALLALFTGSAESLLKESCGLAWHRDVAELFARYDTESMQVALLQKDPALPEEYKKVWSSFLAKKNRPKTDSHTKDRIRTRVLALQREYGVSNYRVYTDLKLNHGNLNAWLKHGSGEKVSLTTARQALAYLQKRA